MSHAEQVNALGKRIEEAAGVDPESTSRRERIEITKIAMREVIREWLDERVRDVGKWTLRGLAAAAVAAIAYFVLTHTGWARA